MAVRNEQDESVNQSCQEHRTVPGNSLDNEPPSFKNVDTDQQMEGEEPVRNVEAQPAYKQVENHSSSIV